VKQKINVKFIWHSFAICAAFLPGGWNLLSEDSISGGGLPGEFPSCDSRWKSPLLYKSTKNNKQQTTNNKQTTP